MRGKGKQARRPARGVDGDVAILSSEQTCRSVQSVNSTNSATFGVGLGRELEVWWQPIHLVFAALGNMQAVLDDALLHLGRFVLIAIGNGG